MTAFPREFRLMLDDVLRRAPQVKGVSGRRDRGRRRTGEQTGTFAGHRAYSEGEDLRQLDWNVYARTGELFLKMLEEEEQRSLVLCLDCSPSMMAGQQPRFFGAKRLAAILGGLALVGLDALHLVTGRGKLQTLQGAVAVSSLMDALDDCPTEPCEEIEIVQAPLESGWQGTVCWISDFAEPDQLVAPLAMLRRHGRRCRGWLPLLPGDTTPELDGWVRLVDPETGQEAVVQLDAELRRAMADELKLLARHQDSVFAAVGYPLIRFPLPVAGDFRLSSWFDGSWTSRF